MNNSLIVIMGLAALFFLKGDTMKKAVGIRNRNPLNIRDNKANAWVGRIGADELGFVIFDTPENGYRAAAKILKSYAKRGIVSINDIISTWAPKNGVDSQGRKYTNHTEEYIAYVSQSLNKSPSDIITPANYPELLHIMSRVEVGSFEWPIATAIAGVSRA